MASTWNASQMFVQYYISNQDEESNFLIPAK